ncbi:hypothetical protein PHYBOEH_007163 [Phytophthora boehmeriae]|uniref:HTH CENPB-type domain-containing protein n=1 Tax=Phytophthora boehmeriae TaxID=109152 RepID=A0A8T1W9Y4_9STRA|nr:hypothetical protein PHYBOEH_007163 [Phytophthora boehmeriae]
MKQWSHSHLAEWATKEFKKVRPIPRSTVQGILKRRHELIDIPDTHRERKRQCSKHIRSSDAQLMEQINAYKSRHENARVTGATVVALAQRVDAIMARREGTGVPTRGWLYHFQKRNNVRFSLCHGGDNGRGGRETPHGTHSTPPSS